MEEMNMTPAEQVEVVDIQFRPGQKVYFFDPAGETYRPGDHVIMDTARGPEYGIVTAGNHRIPAQERNPYNKGHNICQRLHRQTEQRRLHTAGQALGRIPATDAGTDDKR